MSSNTPGKGSHIRQSTDCFVFLEVFSCEGGIQSYVKDMLAKPVQNSLSRAVADVFLLRDRPGSAAGFDALIPSDFTTWLARWAMVGRTAFGHSTVHISRLAHDPERVHVWAHSFATVWSVVLCQWWRLPYIVMTYGKEVWNPLAMPEEQGPAAGGSNLGY
jgi:phosphatidylinositol alpha-1,6-mannosyltransferase